MFIVNTIQVSAVGTLTAVSKFDSEGVREISVRVDDYTCVSVDVVDHDYEGSTEEEG